MKLPEQIDYNLQNKTTNMTKTKPVQPLRQVEDYRGSSALTNIVEKVLNTSLSSAFCEPKLTNNLCIPDSWRCSNLSFRRPKSLKIIIKKVYSLYTEAF